MRSLILILVLFLSVRVYAQKGYFYLRPLLYEKKWSANPGGSYDIVSPQGYSIHVDPLNFFSPKGWASLNNCFLGYRKKNYFIELGIGEDQGSSGIAFSMMTYDHFAKTPYRYHYEGTTYTGIAVNKYSINLGIKLFGKDSVSTGKKLRWEGFLYGGLSLLLRPPIPAKVGGSSGFILDTIGNYSRYVNFHEEIVSNTRIGTLKTVGFMLKAYSRKFAILNLSVQYAQGGQANQTSFIDYSFEFYDGSVYHGKAESKSSGLYIQLGTEINLNKSIRKVKNLFKHDEVK